MVNLKMGEETIKITRQTFFENLFSICLPDTLVDLSEEEMQEKYIMVQRPEIFKTDENYNLKLTMGSGHLSDGEESFTEMRDTQRRIIERLTPGYQDFGTYEKAIEGREVMCMTYKSHTITDDIYNVTFMFPSGEKIITGNLSCMLSDMPGWNAVFIACVDSIKFSSDKE